MEPPNTLAAPLAMARLLRLLAFGAAPPCQEAASWPETEWAAIMEAARQAKLAPLLYRRLLDARVKAPESALARLRRYYLRVAADNSRRFAALEEALLALQRAHVPVILLKGAHLAPVVYGNIALRPMADLDLLVQDADATRALGALAAEGYAPLEGEAWMGDRYGHYGLRRNDGLLLELHQRVGALAIGARIDQACLWQRAQPVQIRQAQGLALEATDLLIHLAIHAVSQHLLQTGLLSLYDISQVLVNRGAQIAAKELIARAQEWRVARAVFLMLALAQRLFNAPVSPDILTALAPPDAEAYLALALHALLAGPQDRPPSSNLVALWSARRWQARLGVYARILWPSASRMRALYHVPLHRSVTPWLYLRRWADLLIRRQKSARQWMRHASEEIDWEPLVRWLAQG